MSPTKLPELYTVRRVKLRCKASFHCKTSSSLSTQFPPLPPLPLPPISSTFSSNSIFSFLDEKDDEFEELSDIDGDDSAINSQSDSTVSWASLDAKQDEVSESVTTTDSGLGSDADISNGTHLPVTYSLFKHCPPVLYFPSAEEKLSKLPRALSKQLKWKMSTITPNVVKNVIARSGFVPSTKRREWIGYWGKHMKASAFRNIHAHQKVNHFPGTFEIGRKDKLWKNLSKAQLKYTKKEYDFIPLTFCLPSEWKTFKRYWDETGHKQKWIIKPPASARGIGIKVVHKLNQIPRKRSIIIQRYLSNPYLINGRKFDLRMYVYVSSYDPLVVYLYDNGLVRFASSKYSHSSKSLSNRYVHLTNYSVNKNNDAYIKNEDEAGTDSHKWGLKALWKYLQMAGQDIDAVKNKIKSIIIKAIISSVPTVTSLSKSHCKYRHTCHELFGFDIFLDYHLKPWLIEVNISPSLHTNAPLDRHIKYGLVKDLFNTAGFLVPQYPVRSKTAGTTSRGQGSNTPITLHMSDSDQDNVTDAQMYFNPGIVVSCDEKAKHAYFSQKYPTDVSSIETILDTLTPDDLRVLMKFEDEASRSGALELIFPTEHTAKYLKYFASPKFYDLLIMQWRKKYGKDIHRGISRLQKLADSQIQFVRQPTNLEHIWCKQNIRNLKRSDKTRDTELFSPRHTATLRTLRLHSPPPLHSPVPHSASPASSSSSTRHPSSSSRSSPSERYKCRPTHSAPATVERTRHHCSIVCNQTTTPSTVTHLPSVDWQSNYYRARKSLNKLKLVKFQNWETANRTQPRANPYLITQWIPAAADRV